MVPALILLFLAGISSCKKDKPDFSKHYYFSFEKDQHDWKAFFSDYPIGEDDFYELSFQRTGLPAPLNPFINALKVTGNNHSDDLLSFIYRRIDSLEPNKTYAVYFHITLASNVAKKSVGAGGSPELALGAGGLSFEPANKFEKVGATDYYRPNFNSALQSHKSNATIKMLGTIGVSDQTTAYTLIDRSNSTDPVFIQTNDKGELWVMVGIDSGFEGITSLYYTSIDIRLKYSR